MRLIFIAQTPIEYIKAMELDFGSKESVVRYISEIKDHDGLLASGYCTLQLAVTLGGESVDFLTLNSDDMTITLTTPPLKFYIGLHMASLDVSFVGGTGNIHNL